MYKFNYKYQKRTSNVQIISYLGSEFFFFKKKLAFGIDYRIVIYGMYEYTLILMILDYIGSIMARTNKRGIAAKKAVAQKQAARLKGGRRFEYPKRKLELEEAKELGVIGTVTNPKGSTYNWFLKGRKICRETKLRTDPDGFRFIRTPNGGSDVVNVTLSGRTAKKLRKNTRKR